MTTIYVDPKTAAQSVALSDGSRGELAVEALEQTGIRYAFDFDHHFHPSFWIDNPLRDGQQVNVLSPEGREQFEIKFR
ncbi:hypothetical protein [Furfurilactobacillus siliginis]|uniref:Uncharacterized protein n=1 Tax=Furfurilactobacillus siliginis TaxID=348151 RepID=A0A0R2LBW3_9LACO|nr:hypothetical protein [Furfurilactobacillus siliginis]KRN97190.1 hypothetical protein IV55_GL000112 [Furfurilactobacillus siliginis]GEK28652.1 hypothetical protein LSI01_09630 [Furfurilactobacillus siliginis]